MGGTGGDGRGQRTEDRGTDAPASRLVSRRPGTRYAAPLARPSGAVLAPPRRGVQSPESRQAERPAARRGRSSPPVPLRPALGGDIHHELTSRPRGDIVCLVEAWPEGSDHSGGTGTEDGSRSEKREAPARDRTWELEMPFLSSTDAPETDDGRRRVARERMERDRTAGPSQEGRETATARRPSAKGRDPAAEWTDSGEMAAGPPKDSGASSGMEWMRR